MAKELGVSRTTVHKYVKTLKEKIESIKTSADQSATELLISELTNAPKYDTTNRYARVVTEPIIKIITDCLKENDKKDLNHQHKQKMKGSDINEKIIKEGYNIKDC
ncbi:MAG: HTH domain-containing protein [Candidatus Cloacimonetes bacterium]|nr:HTH domain-containing protein [Candidatus Cloacimonadota bacterium]